MMSTEVDPSANNEQSPEAGGLSLSERVDTLSPEAAKHWQLTGDIDAAEALQGGPKPKSRTSDATAASSPATAAADTGGTEGAPAPPDQEPQPKPKTNREWRQEVVRLKDKEIERLQRELERRDRESAERRTSAPSTEPVDDSPPGRPKRPRMRDFEGQPDALDKYEAALDAYETARDRWRDDYHAQSRTAETVESRWMDQQQQSRLKYKDFDAVAFSSDVPASFSSIPRLKSRPDGAEIAYYLGKNKDVATRIAELTHVPGIDTPEKYNLFLRMSMTDPRVAAIRARAEALADAEFDRIASLLSRPAASSRSQPRPKPSAEVSVESNGHVVEDELTDAIRRQDFVAYERLANEEAIRGRRR